MVTVQCTQTLIMIMLINMSTRAALTHRSNSAQPTTRDINHASPYTGNQPGAGIRACAIKIDKTGHIQEIQLETKVVGKEDHHVFYYIVT